MEISLRNDVREKLRRLSSPCHLRSTLSIAIDWIIILLGYLLISESNLLVPVGILLIGSRQRALSNLSHDASHVNLFKVKYVNDLVSNIFCALPMFETVGHYRRAHNKHHQFLGDIEKDPDSISHSKYGFNDSAPWKGSPYRNYFLLVSNLKAIKSSFVGSLLELFKKEFLAVITWWLSVLTIILLSLSFESMLIFLGYWLLSRLTSYHLIRIFAEFLDHTGLPNKDIISFTRNLPHKGILNYITHPNSDTYHIVHHLYPNIPHYYLSDADKVLRLRNDYLLGHHCDSYFLGSHSAFNCWVGNCRGEAI